MSKAIQPADYADCLSGVKQRVRQDRTTAQFGWSRKILQNQIKSGAYERAATDVTSRL